MRKKFGIFSIASVALFLCLINAQSQIDSTDSDQLQMKSFVNYRSDSMNNNNKDNIKIKKLTTGLEAGTSFFFSPHNYYGPSYYIAPSLNYYINPRFNLQAGLIFEKSTYYGLQEKNPQMINGMNIMKTSLYARGSYMLSPRVRVQGTVFQTINDVPKQLKYSSPVNYNAKGAIIGFDYKISNSLSIGFDVRMQNNSYYSTNPGYYYPVWGY
jgi:hypothetical protein